MPFVWHVEATWLTHWGRDKMAAFSQTTLSNAFSWMKILEFRLKIHWFIPKGLINNIPALVLIMAWRRPGDKPLSEPMLVRSLTHICVTRPQWVNVNIGIYESIIFNEKLNTENNWNLFPGTQLTTNQRWFRYSLDAVLVTSQCLNKCWHRSLGLNELSFIPLYHIAFISLCVCIYFTQCLRT